MPLITSIPALTLPPSFPIAGLGVVGALFLNLYQQMVVMRRRKEAGVQYPTLYVSESEAASNPKKMRYNCAQRAHANTLESAPYVLALFGYLSLFHPPFATASLLTWIVGRVGYTKGYASGNPAKRMAGYSGFHYLGMLSLICGSLFVSVSKSYALFKAVTA